MSLQDQQSASTERPCRRGAQEAYQSMLVLRQMSGCKLPLYRDTNVDCRLNLAHKQSFWKEGDCEELAGRQQARRGEWNS